MSYIATVDIEATIYENGHPFSSSNSCCCVGIYTSSPVGGRTWHYFDLVRDTDPFSNSYEQIRELLEGAILVCGFNLKFDLNWLSRILGKPLNLKAVWDCQLVEYILSDQTWVMPSLKDALLLRGLPPKNEHIAENYWNLGINTDQVPPAILEERNRDDCETTFKLYQLQTTLVPANQRALVALCNDDLLCFQEMEFNGLLYDREGSERRGKELQIEYDRLCQDLSTRFADGHPINWASGDHVSAVLYGGSAHFRIREMVTKTFKAGPKEVERWGTKEVQFPGIVPPLEGTECKKHGYFKLNDGILRSLRPTTAPGRDLIEGLQQLADMEKQIGTYYFGLPELMTHLQWDAGVIHGTFNQCVTRTGRSSSSRPNLQNFDGRIKSLFRSRYD